MIRLVTGTINDDGMVPAMTERCGRENHERQNPGMCHLPFLDSWRTYKRMATRLYVHTNPFFTRKKEHALQEQAGLQIKDHTTGHFHGMTLSMPDVMRSNLLRTSAVGCSGLITSSITSSQRVVERFPKEDLRRCRASRCTNNQLCARFQVLKRTVRVSNALDSQTCRQFALARRFPIDSG